MHFRSWKLLLVRLKRRERSLPSSIPHSHPARVGGGDGDSDGLELEGLRVTLALEPACCTSLAYGSCTVAAAALLAARRACWICWFRRLTTRRMQGVRWVDVALRTAPRHYIRICRRPRWMSRAGAVAVSGTAEQERKTARLICCAVYTLETVVMPAWIGRGGSVIFAGTGTESQIGDMRKAGQWNLGHGVVLRTPWSPHLRCVSYLTRAPASQLAASHL
jgi:hypothetical protein